MGYGEDFVIASEDEGERLYILLRGAGVPGMGGPLSRFSQRLYAWLLEQKGITKCVVAESSGQPFQHTQSLSTGKTCAKSIIHPTGAVYICEDCRLSIHGGCH